MVVGNFTPCWSRSNGVQEFQKRLGAASDLPFGATASGGAHFRLLPGLLPAVTLRQRLNALAPGLTPARARNDARVEMPDLEFADSDGRWLVMTVIPAGKSGETIAGALQMNCRATPPAEARNASLLVTGSPDFVVKTLAFTVQKPEQIQGSLQPEVASIESWASLRVRLLTSPATGS